MSKDSPNIIRGKTKTHRYLLRVENSGESSPADAQQVAERVRSILGSRESASHFRVGTSALEFNVFAKDDTDLRDKRDLLAKAGLKVLTSKLLDTSTSWTSDGEALAEGVAFFNEERYWEAHEVLEQVWRNAKGVERDTVQSLILTCAAFVHYQKGETEICLSVLHRARAKMNSSAKKIHFDIKSLRSNVDSILNSGQVRLFKL